MEMIKLTSMNHVKLHTLFQAENFISGVDNNITLYHLMVNMDGNYNNSWDNNLNKSKNYILLDGKFFSDNRTALYYIYAQYVGTEVIWYSITNKYNHIRNGYQCHHDLNKNFWNKSYLDDKLSDTKK